MDGDPTTKFLERFKSDSEWDAVIRNVPIFAPHVVVARQVSATDQKTGQPYQKSELDTVQYAHDLTEISEQLAAKKQDGWRVVDVVTPERLGEIAAVMGSNISRTGNVPKVTVGHTDLKNLQDQKKQPEIVGYHFNPHYGTWGPQGNPGLLVDRYIERGKLSSLKDDPSQPNTTKYPFCSSEFYSRENNIDSTALLSTTPQLNLGIVTYSAMSDRGPVYCYAMEGGSFGSQSASPPPSGSAPPPSPTGQPDAMAPTPEEYQRHERCQMQYEQKHTPNLKAMHSAFAAQQQPQAPGAQPPPSPPASAPPIGGAPPMAPQAPMQHQSPMGTTFTNASAGNGQMPQHPRPYQRDTEMDQQQFDAIQLRMQALEKQNADQAAELKVLKDSRVSEQQQYARKQGNAMLAQCIAEGYFTNASEDDLKDHLEQLASADDGGRDKLVERWKRHYQRNPAASTQGGFIPGIDRDALLPIRDLQKIASEDDHLAVQHYMRTHETEAKYLSDDGTQLYADAEEFVLKQKQEKRKIA